ncbi:MAG: hypothetical protein EHM23_35590 [Acidobacteria bacterium]|nr:MAG: hypothetical protein EHM23_35590 [Acidobacteriota bacterium]
MWEILSQISAITIFLAIAGAGFLFLLISLVFGELFEVFGDFDHDWDHDLGHGGPGFFSSRVLSVFITAFGGIGAIAVSRGYTIFASSLMGFGGGVLLATPVYFFARFLFSQQASSMVQVSDLIGRTAQVTVAIPAGNVGQIRCLLGNEVIEKTARSRDGSAIPFNALVKVEELIGESVIVSPVAKESTTPATPRQSS